MKRRSFLAVPAVGALLPGFTGRESIALLAGTDTAASPQAGVEPRFRQRLHQDFSTYIPGVEYFCLGNGDIIATLQFSPEQSGELPPTYLGLTLMDAERFARKWSTFLFHPERGFDRSMLSVTVDGKGYTATPATLRGVEWRDIEGVPTVVLEWTAGALAVEERFSVPAEGQLLFRTVLLRNTGSAPVQPRLQLQLVPNFGLFDDIRVDEKSRTVHAHGFADMRLLCLSAKAAVAGRYDLNVEPGPIASGSSAEVRYAYALNGAEKVLARPSGTAVLQRAAAAYWEKRSRVTSGNAEVDRLFGLARTGLKALAGRSGKRDSGFWMYNMEWVRDDMMMVAGMLQAGHHAEAQALLRKVLEKSIGEDGRTIESSRWSGHDYTELDQNGQVLFGVWTYLAWTGDDAFIRPYWERIRRAGDFPLQDVFLDRRAGMVRNKREYWERSDSFGLEDGFELAYQFWVSYGLACGAEVAARLGDAATAQRWRTASASLRHAMLEDPTFRLIEEGHLIKRRTRDGRWQRTMIPPNRNAMPPGSPAATNEKPECDPDSANLLPIIFGMVDATSDTGRKTLADVELLWNQQWTHGGYGRYNTTSEPDPPGPWPIASLFVARAAAEAGDPEKVWRVIRWLLTIHGGKSGGWFERYGPSITPPAPPVCIVGWTYAEAMGLIVHHFLGFRPGLDVLTVRPRPVTGLDALDGTLTVRGIRVHVNVKRATGSPSATVDGRAVPFVDGTLRVPYPKGRKTMEIVLAV
jgi:hypothetical protein